MNRLCELIVDFFHAVASSPGRLRTVLTPLFASFFVGIVLSAIAASFFLDRFFGLPRFIPHVPGILLSLPFIIGGAFLWLWSVIRFFKTKGTPVPVNPPPILITDGPYFYSRNPMMTGVFLMLAGIGILSGSVALSFIVTPLFVVVSLLEFRYIEEPELEKRLGKAYTEYRKLTPAIIPRIRRGSKTLL